MNPSLARKTTWAALMGAALFLGACVTSNEEKGPGVDPEFADAEINARVAGRSLAGSFDQGKDWSASFTAPAGLQALGGISTSVGALRKQASLAAGIDLGGELHADLDDTAKGYATVYAEYQLGLAHVKDTAIVKWDANARDAIKDNENILSFKRVSTALGGRIETAAFTDGDGDGQVTPVPGKDNKVRLVLTVQDKDAIETTTLLIGAGADGDFDAEGDNTILQAGWIKTKGGATAKVGFRNRAGGTEIVKGDTMTVRLETTAARAEDTLKSAVIEFVMNMGQDLKSDSDDVCYAIHVKTSKRLGLERETEFNFVSAQPIPHGAQPVAGAFNGKATYANGKSAVLDGTFSPAGFSVNYTGPEGNTVSVEFTRQGDLVSNP